METERLNVNEKQFTADKKKQLAEQIIHSTCFFIRPMDMNFGKVWEIV